MPSTHASEVVQASLFDLTCCLCSQSASIDDEPWLCLCTPEVRRVHRACTHRRQPEAVCSSCGLANQHRRIMTARRNARVVIIGAGPAGLAAARFLQERGVTPIVLEARTRLGGRIDTVQMGTSRVDLGAAFIHGCDASYNPVFKLAAELGVKVDQTAGGYSGGWGQNAPWFDTSTGRRLSRAHVNKVWAWVVAAKALMDTTPLRTMHQWEASLAEQRESPSKKGP